MTVRDLVAGICQEYQLTNYQVRTLPEKTLLNLEANATAVENAEIAIEDVDKMLSNFQLDNLHTSELITGTYWYSPLLIQMECLSLFLVIHILLLSPLS